MARIERIAEEAGNKVFLEFCKKNGITVSDIQQIADPMGNTSLPSSSDGRSRPSSSSGYRYDARRGEDRRDNRSRRTEDRRDDYRNDRSRFNDDRGR